MITNKNALANWLICGKLFEILRANSGYVYIQETPRPGMSPEIIYNFYPNPTEKNTKLIGGLIPNLVIRETSLKYAINALSLSDLTSQQKETLTRFLTFDLTLSAEQTERVILEAHPPKIKVSKNGNLIGEYLLIDYQEQGPISEVKLVGVPLLNSTTTAFELEGFTKSGVFFSGDFIHDASWNTDHLLFKINPSQ